MGIDIIRAFDFVHQNKPSGAHVVLVDRVWPRGLRKDELGLDEWARDLAPSTELRKWFNHDPAKWADFYHRYREELETHWPELKRLARIAQEQKLILLYGARDQEYNQAVVLQQILAELRDQDAA